MKALKRFGGYTLLFVLSLVPSVIAYVYDASANQVGMIYVASIIWCACLWAGMHIKGNLSYILLGLLALIPAGIGYAYGIATGLIIQILLVSLAWVGAFWGTITLIEMNENLI
ncbi:hypothetical protein ACFL6T_02515 [Candidatus Zixiibacteriota bacterium]